MTRPKCSFLLLVALPAALVLPSCRGEVSPKPPIHPVLDMDFQEKYVAQSENRFFADKRAMRQPVKGTVARGHLFEHDPDPKVRKLYVYKNGDQYVTENPVEKTRENVERGRERFDIYCAVCHGMSGRGNGPVGVRWPVQPVSYLSKAGPVPYPDREGGDQRADRIEWERMKTMPDGQFFETITKGKGTMPAYGHVVPAEDRWKIIHYIKVLQLRAGN